jgi:hypothetical protein
MALILTDSRFPIGSTVDYEVLPSEQGLIEEGHALRLVWQNGAAYVARTIGDGDEQFIGVAFGPRRPLSAYGVIQKTYNISFADGTKEFTDVHSVPTIAGSQTVSVFKTNANGSVTYFTPTATAATAPAAASQVQVKSLSPVDLVFYAPSANGGDDGVTVSITFNYIPTIDDVQYGRGDTGWAYSSEQSDYVGRVAVITNSYSVVTDKFIASGDWWNAPGGLQVVAGGYFATSAFATGTTVSGIGLQPGRGFVRLLQGPVAYDNGETGIRLSINM